MKNLKKYILFDNDGVLVETEKWYFEANKKSLALLGLNPNNSIRFKIESPKWL